MYYICTIIVFTDNVMSAVANTMMRFILNVAMCTLMISLRSIAGCQPGSPRDSPMYKGLRAALRASYLSLSAAMLNSFTKSSVAYSPKLLKPSCAEDILSGGVYIHDDFISADLAESVRNDIGMVEKAGLFRTSGLSNSAYGKMQRFSSSDRRVCPVPLYSSTDESALYGSSFTTISSLVKTLRSELSVLLNRPSLVDSNLEHESYFSIYSAGSLLPRHMDERHEEIKVCISAGTTCFPASIHIIPATCVC